jgi:hypothetical protein
MNYIKFDHNTIDLKTFCKLYKYYQSQQQFDTFFSFFKQNEFKRDTINKFLSFQKKKQMLKTTSYSEFKYIFSIEQIDSFIIFSETTIFQKTKYIIEHVFY